MNKKLLPMILAGSICVFSQIPPTTPQTPADPKPEIAPKFSDVLGTGELVLLNDSGAVAAPLDFGQMARQKLQLFSLDGMSWTSTRFVVQGIDGTNPYQPGRPLVSPGPNGIAEVHIAQPDLDQSPAVSYDFRIPAAEPKWHFAASGFLTGGSFFSDNLPSSPAQRGFLQQSDKFNHFYQPSAELGGYFKRWLYFLFTGSGRWANQTVPEAAPGTNVSVYHLFGNVRATIQASKKDRIDLLIVGTRLNSSNYATPFELEALAGRAMAPPIGPQPNMREEDHVDFVQLGWSRDLFGGPLELRYSYSAAHTDTVATNLPANYTSLVQNDQATTYIDLGSGAVNGGPLMQTLGVFPQHRLNGAWRSRDLHHGSIAHSFTVSGMYGRSESEIRELFPPYVEAILANGQPDSALVLNTPLDTLSVLKPWQIGVDDRIRIGANFLIDAGVQFSSWSGSIPAQSSPSSDGVNVRNYASQGSIVTWRNASPRIGFAWNVPQGRGLVMRASYGRNYHPLSGRDLDFGNPNSLSGLEYQWSDPNHDGRFELSELGTLLRRFGGSYSQIDPNLRDPYVDQFNASAEIALPRGFTARVRWFDAIDQNRIAAINTGVPFSSYQAVQVADPLGPSLTVFNQSPASFGKDQFLLTNPDGLRMDQKGVVMESTYRRDRLQLRGSLMVNKSWGPTNPGDDGWQNDSGVIGALYANPNAMLFATGHPALDRGYAGNFSAIYQTSKRLGNIEILNDGVFLGGYPYARMLLVTGLNQGPMLVPTGPRGVNGSRADGVVQWNLRVARGFVVRRGQMRVMADLFNLANSASRMRVNDLTGASFGSPLELQPPRYLRAGVSYQF